METIAVYWESKIRTYGFNLLEKLTLCQITLSPGAMGALGKALIIAGDDGAVFRLVWAETDNPDQLRFFLLCDDMDWNRLRLFMERYERPGSGVAPISRTVVDVICFQGPHFGDRHGIMGFTYKALTHGQVPLLAATCSVATIYLVLPAGWGGKAQVILSEAFEIPKSVK
jgi:hypothetical protein